MIIKNAKVFRECGTFEKTDIECGERIISIGNANGEADIDAAIQHMVEEVERLRHVSPLWDRVSNTVRPPLKIKGSP